MIVKHPRFERLRGFADGSLQPSKRHVVSAHLARCPRCRDRVRWVREVRDAAAENSGAAPAGAWERIRARVETGEVVLLPITEPRGMRPLHRGRVGRSEIAAAGLVLVLAAGGSAMIPGSPVRAWVEGRFAKAAEGRPTRDQPAGLGAAAAGPRTALLVAPEAGSLAIAVERPDPRLRIRIRLAEAEELELHAAGAAAMARFRSGPGRLTISQAGAGELLLALPRSAAVLTLSVDGVTFLEKRGTRLRILAPVVDTAGSELILPVRP